jgi:sugar O-acyltransferase (sialic acid O-acetyltransferase NeuD family)
MSRIVGLGAGGHAKVMIEIFQMVGEHEIVGLLDTKEELRDTELLGIPVLGGDDLLTELLAQGVESAFIGLAGTGDTQPRRNLYERALAAGFRIVPAIHPKAIISPSASLGDGITVMAGAVINAQANIGANVIVNTGAIVEHECRIGDHVHLATGSRLCSTVKVGDGAHIGTGSTVKQCVSVGENAVVGAGAVVLDDVPPMAIVAGVPARPLKKS